MLGLKSEPKEELKSEPKEELKSEPKEELKSEPKEELKSEPKEELKSEPKEELKSEPKEELEQYFQEAVSLYNDKLSIIENDMRSKTDWQGVSRNDGILMYMMIRNFKPKIVMEAGCSHGWLSQWIVHALRTNGKGNLYAFEIQQDYINIARKYLKDFNDIIEFVEGDLTPSLSCAYGLVGGSEKYNSMPNSKKNTLMKTLAKIGFIDFLIMDGYHNYQFGKWWTTSVVPYVSKGGIVAVHDIVYKNGDIIPDPSMGDESVAVKELLKYRPRYKPQLDYKRILPEDYTNGVGFIFIREEDTNITKREI